MFRRFKQKIYRKKKIPVGFVEAKEVFPVGKEVCIRTLEGDLDVEIREDLYIMIGIQGEVYPIERAKFERSYKRLEEEYVFAGEYQPAIKDSVEGVTVSLIPFAKACVATGESFIFARPLDHRVKVFTAWDKEKYMLGREGDLLAVRKDDLHDVYVIARDIFYKSYNREAEPRKIWRSSKFRMQEWRIHISMKKWIRHLFYRKFRSYRGKLKYLFALL